MSEIKPDDPRGGPRHVDSKVVEDESAPLMPPPPPAEEIPALPALDEVSSAVVAEAPDAGDTDPMVPSSSELAAAKYYAIAFLAVVIPLGLLLLGLLVIAFVHSLSFLK